MICVLSLQASLSASDLPKQPDLVDEMAYLCKLSLSCVAPCVSLQAHCCPSHRQEPLPLQMAPPSGLHSSMRLVARAHLFNGTWKIGVYEVSQKFSDVAS